MCRLGRYGCIPSSNGVGWRLHNIIRPSRAHAYKWSAEQNRYGRVKFTVSPWAGVVGRPIGPVSRTTSIRTGSCAMRVPQCSHVFMEYAQAQTGPWIRKWD